jgi:hypothetical protein
MEPCGLRWAGLRLGRGSEKLWMIINDHGILPHRFRCHTSSKVHGQSCMSKIEFPEVHWGQGRLSIMSCSVNIKKIIFTAYLWAESP